MSEDRTAYLGLGSNVGQRLANLRQAVRVLDATPNIRVHACSSVYETEAHTRGPADGLADFLNLVLHIETGLPPLELLDVCLSLESAAGRHRKQGSWLPRSIDIDILVFADQVLDSERLKVPHPRMAERRFVLLPLADLAPELHVPEPFSTTVSDLLSRCTDSLRIERRYAGSAVLPTGGGRP